MDRSLKYQRHQIFKELTVILTAFDVQEAVMGRENSSRRKNLWPELILEGFNKDGDKKTMTLKQKRVLIISACGLIGNKFSKMRISIM